MCVCVCVYVCVCVHVGGGWPGVQIHKWTMWEFKGDREVGTIAHQEKNVKCVCMCMCVYVCVVVCACVECAH